MADPFISPAALHARLGWTDAPRIIDLRLDEDVALHPVRLPAAERLSLAEIGGVPDGGPVVAYCHKGGKLSQIGAAMLRARGVPAVALTGGIVDWMEQGRPVLGCDPVPDSWLAPLEPAWGEVVCAWLLIRVITKRAQVLWIERDQIAPGLKLHDAKALPDDPEVLRASYGLVGWPAFPEADPAGALLTGRLRRGADPLDLVDDLYAVGAA